jgi:hypothetical protein
MINDGIDNPLHYTMQIILSAVFQNEQTALVFNFPAWQNTPPCVPLIFLQGSALWHICQKRMGIWTGIYNLGICRQVLARLFESFFV